MKFEVNPLLKDNKYTYSVDRVYNETEVDNIKEAQLIDDFGLPKINTAGVFKGYVSKAGDKYTVALDGDPDNPLIKEFKFAVTPVEQYVELTKKVKIPLTIDVNNEVDFEFDEDNKIPANIVAELKCKLFALEIKKRIDDALDKWTKKDTDFEKDKPVSSFEYDLTGKSNS